MKKLFTDKDYNTAKSTDKLPCKCYGCGTTFKTSKTLITQELKQVRGRVKYCSIECLGVSRRKSKMVTCKNCKIEFTKLRCEIQNTKNDFCCKSCSAIYNNAHKKYGTRRSKLEIYVEKQLMKLYPSLNFHFNRKDSIGSEIDILIPTLSLAFELSGVFHYEPIYGEEKLLKIQKNDLLKVKKCRDKNITLIVIDTRSQKRFTKVSSQVFIDQIVKAINNKSGGQRKIQTFN